VQHFLTLAASKYRKIGKMHQHDLLKDQAMKMEKFPVKKIDEFLRNEEIDS